MDPEVDKDLEVGRVPEVVMDPEVDKDQVADKVLEALKVQELQLRAMKKERSLEIIAMNFTGTLFYSKSCSSFIA